MNSLKRKVLETRDKALHFWQQTQASDLLYRRLMRHSCPHPAHRVRAFDDHGTIFEFCGDCRESVSR